LIGPLFVLGCALLAAIWFLTRRHVSPDSGLVWRTINVHGLERRYLLHASDEGSRQKPLLICFHGGFVRVDSLAERSGIAEAGRRQGCIVIFPEAADGWIDARPERGGSARDVDFVDALLDSLVRKKQIDADRVFALGISNGGLFVFRLANDRPLRFAALATALASMPLVALSPVSGPPVPIAMIFGRQDRVMWQGGRLERGVGEVGSADATRRFWLRRNDANQMPQTQRRVSAGRQIEIEDYAARPGGAPVRFVSIGNWGHRWPLWNPAPPGSEDNFNAADLIIEFFSELHLSGTSAPIFPAAAGEHNANA
jgi:polyhydroxybutyrate depolymerase